MIDNIKKVYTVFYIHTDSAELSEILGVYNSKEKAVSELIERANYRNINGQLTQYMKPTNDYKSYDEIFSLVYNKMELIDHDIYRITELPCL